MNTTTRMIQAATFTLAAAAAGCGGGDANIMVGDVSFEPKSQGYLIANKFDCDALPNDQQRIVLTGEPAACGNVLAASGGRRQRDWPLLPFSSGSMRSGEDCERPPRTMSPAGRTVQVGRRSFIVLRRTAAPAIQDDRAWYFCRA